MLTFPGSLGTAPGIGIMGMDKSVEASLQAYEKALQMAINPQLSTDEIVDRAKVFASFLTQPLANAPTLPERQPVGFRAV